MHYFIFPDIDTTLYSASSSKNSGLDEILEIRKDQKRRGEFMGVSRILMKFDLSYISQSIVRGLITNPKYYLNLHDANSVELSYSQSIYAYPVSQSWVSGEGFSSDDPITSEGASWDFRTGANEDDVWLSGSVSYQRGGTFFGEVYASQSFEYKTSDMRMDVTPIVNKWFDGTYPNQGFLLKRSGSMGNTDTSLAEGNTDHLGNFKFFSRETHTVFPPKLEVVWDDSSWSTGSLSALSSDNLNDMVLYMRGLRPEYREKSKVKFRVTGRERYPEKSYSTSGYSTGYTTVKYLPSGSSYYQIRDAYTEDIIVPFGDGTKLSCDSTGNYFNLWMDGLQAERFYRVEYKIVSGSGTSDETVEFYDEKHSFKVVR